MQPGPNQSTQTVVVGQGGVYSNNPYTGTQVVVVQNQPSVGPTVIGIFVIIYGVIGVIFTAIGMLGLSLLMDAGSELYDSSIAEYEGFIMISSIIAIIGSIGYIGSGIMIIQRKKLGVYIAWGILAVATIFNIMTEFIAPGYSGMSVGAGMATNIACGLFCGVMIAVPLMDTGSNME